MELKMVEFVEALQKAPQQPTYVPHPVSEYVLKHIYEPMLRDEAVRFETLDFHAFTSDDLHDLDVLLCEMDQMQERLVKLNNVFCSGKPIPHPEKSFC